MTKVFIVKTAKWLGLLIASLVLFVAIFTTWSLARLNTLSNDGLVPVAPEPLLVIDNVNLLTMHQPTVAFNQQLVIRNGIIESINPSNTPVPPQSRKIEAEGAFVLPGLIDMHVHIHEQKHLMLSLAYGFTSVRALHGNSSGLRWKKQIANNEWLASDLFISSPILNGASAHALAQKVLTPEQAIKQVRLAKHKGYDLIKAYGYLEPKVFSAMVKEANALNIPVAKHAPHPIDGSNWQELKGLQSMEHVEDIFQGPLNFSYDYDLLEKTAEKLKELNVPITPTLTTFYHLMQISSQKQAFIDSLELEYQNPFFRELLQPSVDRWLADTPEQSAYHQKEFKFLKEIVAEFNQHGIPLLLGSDAGTMFSIPGIDSHRELLLLSSTGLSNFEALKTATVNPAKALKQFDRLGTIAIGKKADLMLVKNNPLESFEQLDSPIAVVKNGQWLDQKSLQALKDSAKNPQRYFWTVIMVLEDLIDRW